MAGEAIFIGYRRDDTADVAGRIYDAMAQRFGKTRVFKDVDNIGPGVDFGDYIKTVLPRCAVALVLIGPHWLESSDETGKRRLDDDHDWVRIEIETALATAGLLVVPVLVNGARMPRAKKCRRALSHCYGATQRSFGATRIFTTTSSGLLERCAQALTPEFSTSARSAAKLPPLHPLSDRGARSEHRF